MRRCGEILPAVAGGISATGGQARKTMEYVYVLKSLKDGSLYKGMSSDVEKRFKEHERGKCRTTKRMLPVKLVFVQICENIQEARELEKYLKSGAGREIIQGII